LSAQSRRRIVLLGAAGRDFHNFNVVYRDDPGVEVVAFTAAQIPDIAGRRYPPPLAGPHYPDGIPILEEVGLEEICRRNQADEVVFAYSDVTHEHVMHLASRALASGADFSLLGPRRTMLKSKLPVIAVTAVRTGCGKSVIARWLSQRLSVRGLRVAVLRHPMPYGDLAAAAAQRFATLADVDAAGATAEEREEYEPHLALGHVVFAGVDYARILPLAEREADVIVWDGGNNDFPFLVPDLSVTLADALRPGQIAGYHPGEAVARMADILVINKVNDAPPGAVEAVRAELHDVNGRAPIVLAASEVGLEDAGKVRGRRVLVVEDGPTITHGGASHGAGYVAAMTVGAAAIVDPRTSADPEIRKVFDTYAHIGKVLPAVGYGKNQLEALRRTINESTAEVVVSGAPFDLARVIKLDKPLVRARYEFAEAGEPTLASFVDAFIAARFAERI
jgi:predicted GTPase